MGPILADSLIWTVFALVTCGLSQRLRWRLNSEPCAPKTRSARLSLVSTAASLLGLIALACLRPVQAEELFRDGFNVPGLAGWQIKEGAWTVTNGSLAAKERFSAVLREKETFQDGVVEADVAYESDKPFAASGLLFRIGENFTGYAVCLREVEKGEHPHFGAWERPVLQLFRKDANAWKLLQESKVMGCRSGLLRHLKVACRGADLFVYYEDMDTPVLKEFDDRYNRPGRVGLYKDHFGFGRFDNFAISTIGETLAPSLRTDWSWVRGAVYVRSDAVNSVEMWHDYWNHTVLLDRELFLAATYGCNMIQAYLHWIVWDHDREDYLKKIDDFLTRAAKYGLKVNLIFWDDCGHVEPSLTFAAPIPGRHNSQMMMNPSHRIRDDAAEMIAHRDRFRDYVQGIVAHFKDDPRIAFWQLYNEALGAKERYRTSDTDANINRLMGWTREWVKASGTRIPVTATGGGFYGPKYSDFPTYHSYSGGGQPLPNASGGPEHLCTETLNRPAAPIQACLRDLAGQQNGFVVWELMIGRDNCRFPWGHPDGMDEPAAPFHGVIYPDGHPWDVSEVKALLGDAAFDALEKGVFTVEYFDVKFAKTKKKSITPWIDFDLGDEPGYGSPDASAGIGKDDFSIRWTGRLVAPDSGAFTFLADCDGELELTIDDTKVIEKVGGARREAAGNINLKSGQTYSVKIDYFHEKGAASCHVDWRGPNFGKQRFRLGTSAFTQPPNSRRLDTAAP